MAERRIECEWGADGARDLARRCAVIVVVDVLSFSTAVDVATARGAAIYPWGAPDAALAAFASRIDAEIAGTRRSGARYSLSPRSLAAILPGTRLVLPSPNGSAIARSVDGAALFAGCLRNAASVARAAAAVPGDIGVVPAGERWDGGGLRPAIEDWLGAGAIIARLRGALSAEAVAARAAFTALAGSLEETLRAARSGRELIDAGFPEDVAFAAALNVSPAAPRLADDAFRACGLVAH
jgi:2-phosphosulfolactate phosphatase